MAAEGVFLACLRRADAAQGAAAAGTAFVRLHPATARALWRRAVDDALGASSTVSSDNNDDNVWRITSETGASPHVASGIEFLPLQLDGMEEGDDDTTTTTSATVYASYNGGEIAPENAVQVPAGLCLENGNFHGRLRVRALAAVLYATEVTVQPVSGHDWRLLQRHADWLETGGLLAQISLVFPNQVMVLSLPGGVTARVRILSVTSDTAASLWPQAEDSMDITQYPPCRRIVADTEVVLLPKIDDAEALGTIEEYWLHPAQQDYGTAMRQLHTQLKTVRSLVMCPPGTVVLPQTDAGWNDGSRPCYARVSAVGGTDNTDDNDDFLSSHVVRIVYSDEVEKNRIVLHPMIRLSLGLALLEDKVKIEPVSQADVDRALLQGRRLVDKQCIDIQEIRLLHHGDPPCYPSLLSANALSPHGGMRRTEADQFLPIHVGSLVCAQWLGDPEEPGLFKVTMNADDDPPALSSRNSSVCLAVEDMRHLLRSKASQGFLLAPVHNVFDRQLIDVLPQGSILTQTITSLQSTIVRNNAIVLAGKSGSGRTHAALMLAAMSHFLVDSRTAYLDCKALKNNRRMADLLDAIRDLFDDKKTGHLLVVLDDLSELVVPMELEASRGSGAQMQQPNWTELEQSKLVRDHLRHLIATFNRGLTVVVTCDESEVVKSIFPVSTKVTILELPLFMADERLDLAVSRMQTCQDARLEDEFVRKAVASLDFEGASRSFMPCDVCIVVSRVAKALNGSEWTPASLTDTCREVLEGYVPAGRDTAAFEPVTLNSTWEDVGGLFEAKASLLDAVFRPSVYRRIYEKSRVRLPRGILLFGPPGCGKSYMVPALAAWCKLPLIMCRGPELLDRYIGGSEAKVRELFTRAHQSAPCILCLDEFDALAPKRGTDSTGVTDRVVNQLLTFLDGVEDFSTAGTVYVVAATSRPDKIDPALLRPGRLEKHVYVGLPESRDELLDIIQHVARKYTVQEGAIEIFLSSFAAEGKFLSPADIRAGFQTAHLLAVHERLSKKPELSDSAADIVLNAPFLLQGFSKVRPSLSAEDTAYYRRTQERFQGKKPQLGDGDRASGGQKGATKPLQTTLR